MRAIDPDLEDCLRRANPYVETYAEVSVPDVGKVLRRTDQFLAPYLAGNVGVGANGELKINPGVGAIAAFAGEQTYFDLNGENEERRRKGITWTVDSTFDRALLRSFTARLQRQPLAGVFYLDLDFQLQIFRITRSPGAIEKSVKGVVQTTPFTQYVFTPILSSPAVIKAASIAWDGAQKTTLSFDLSAYNIVLQNTPGDATRPEFTGELPQYHFVITPIKHPKGTGYFRWLCDTATARDVAGVGHFERVFWARENESEQWAPTAQGDVPAAAVNVETYAGPQQAFYDIDLGRAPDVAGGAVGRVVFERTIPPGAELTWLGLSTDGGVNFNPVKHGDIVAIAQQTYKLAVTMYAGAGGRSSPGIRAFGIEFRIPIDVSAESAISWPTKEVAVPWLAGSIPEAKLKVVRTGIRDYDDPASQLAAKYSTTKLEVDIYLRSKHPSVTRDKWLLQERLSVTNRVPSATSEEFSLLSYLHRLKKKIPEKRESVTSIHTVQAGSTAAQLIVAPALPGVTAGGNELDNKHFYIRVPKTAKIEFVDGFIQEVAGNTNVDRLDFAPALPAVLNTGDKIELHSGVFGTAAVIWQDYDPADVWFELLTTYAGVPSERIGHGTLPRGGRPPKVADRAPGDAPTQAKLKVTFAAREDEPVDEMIDQVSFICGGATVEIDGQICFVQIYPLYDATGKVSVPLPPIARTFDPRDVSVPSTSPSLESRTTVVTAIYGVNAAATNKDAYPERLTVGVDVDAVAWLTQQSIEAIGNSELPEKIGRWLYNSADSGLYLTTQVTAQVVRAGSTGLRVFGFNSIDANPELIPGDVCVLITDQYTDYDPATARELRGWLAVKGVLVKVGNQGRQLGMYVLGLADNVTTLKGFATGSLSGVGEPPGPPLIVADFNSAGKATITVFAGEGTVSAKIAVSDVATPADATVEATTAINGDIFQVLFNTPIIAPGGTIFIKLFEYTELDGGGIRSQPFPIQFQRPTGDTAAPPYADFQQIAESQTAMTHRLTGALEPGDTGPLQYRYRVDAGGAIGAWSAWAAFPSGGGTYVDIVTSKSPFYPKILVGQVRDASPVPVESALVTADIMGRFESHKPGSGRIDEAIPMSSGFVPFEYGADTAVGIVTTAALDFISPTMIDSSKRVTNVFRTATTEPVTNLFKRGVDAASDVVTTTTRTFVDPTTATQVDSSGRIVGVYRFGVVEPVNNLVKFGDAITDAMLSANIPRLNAASTGLVFTNYITSGGFYHPGVFDSTGKTISGSWTMNATPLLTIARNDGFYALNVTNGVDQDLLFGNTISGASDKTAYIWPSVGTNLVLGTQQTEKLRIMHGGGVEAVGSFRAKGLQSAFGAGPGLELYYYSPGVYAGVQAYNRTTAAYIKLALQGQEIWLGYDGNARGGGTQPTYAWGAFTTGSASGGVFTSAYHAVMFSTIASDNYTSGAIEVREYNLGGAQTGVGSQSPRIGFHWGGRDAGMIGFDANGIFNVWGQDTTTHKALRLGVLTFASGATGYHSFLAQDTATLIIKSAHSTSVGLRFETTGAVLRGYVYGDATGFGLLHDGANWALRIGLSGGGLVQMFGDWEFFDGSTGHWKVASVIVNSGVWSQGSGPTPRDGTIILEY